MLLAGVVRGQYNYSFQTCIHKHRTTHFHSLDLTWLFPALWEELRKETLEEEAGGSVTETGT